MAINFRRIKFWLRGHFRFKTWYREVSISLVVSIVALYVSIEIGIRFDPQIMDYWLRLRGTVAAPKDVLLVAVDEESHVALKVSTLEPWPRERMAEFLEKASKHNPRAVILDFSFSEDLDAQTDQRLAHAMSLSPTYIAYVEKYKRKLLPTGELSAEEVAFPIMPSQTFTNAGARLFYAIISLSSGVARTFDTYDYKDFGQGPVTAFTPVLFGDGALPSSLPGKGDFINYYGPSGAIPSVSIHEIIKGSDEVLAPLIKDKFVFVGQKLAMSYAAQQTDTFLTPYGVSMAGVEIHATALSNLLDGSWIRSYLGPRQISWTLVITFVIAYSLFRVSPMRGFFIVIGSMVTWLAISYVMFLNGAFLPGATTILFVIPFAYTLFNLRVHLQARALERAIGLKR